MRIYHTILLASCVLMSFASANTIVNVSNFLSPAGPALPIYHTDGYVDYGRSWAVGRYTGNLNATGISPFEALLNFDQNGSEGGFLPNHPGFIESSVIDAQTSTNGTDRFTDPMQGGPWPIVVLIGNGPTLRTSFNFILIDTGQYWKPEPLFGEGQEDILLTDVRRVFGTFTTFQGGTGTFAQFNGGLSLGFPTIGSAGISLSSVRTLPVNNNDGGLKVTIQSINGAPIPGASWGIRSSGTKRSSGNTLLGLNPGLYPIDFFPPGSNIPISFPPGPDPVVSGGMIAEYKLVYNQPVIPPTPPNFSSINKSENAVVLTWNSTAGIFYSIQFSRNLETGTWTDVVTRLEAAPGSITTYQDMNIERLALKTGFYRMRAEY